MLSDCCSCFFFIVSLGFGGFDIFYVWVQFYQFCVFGISIFFENPIANLMLMVVQVELLHELKGCLSRSDYQFSSAAQSCPTLCDPMNCSMPGLPVHYQIPEFTQTHVHWVSDAIQPSHPLSSPSPPAPNPSQHQSLFQWVNSLHEVAKVLEFQPQHQSFQWTPRTGLL